MSPLLCSLYSPPYPSRLRRDVVLGDCTSTLLAGDVIQMQAYDLIMVIVLAVTTFYGFRRGLAWQIASVAAIVVSYIVAMQFRDVVAAKINAQPPWNTFAAMLILYVATSFVIWVVFQLVRGFIDQAKLKEFDQQLGALFGLGKGILLCVIITLFAVTLTQPKTRQQIIDSKSGYYITRLLDQADAVMPAELHDFLSPYLEKLDRGLNGEDESLDIDEFRPLEELLPSGQGGGFRAADNESESGSWFGDLGSDANADSASGYPANADRQRRYQFDRR
ncbi:MAG: CvpA family protein [Planctomycetales bacterium]|nr:CvpA family protein [Planctomycetales bacterium]MCA9166318.1 CvpA family protein [Planctomycetales bacterium]